MTGSPTHPQPSRETSLQAVGLRRRPISLWLAELILAGLVVVLTSWLVGVLLVPGFLSDSGPVPPFVSDARLDSSRARLAFGLPLAVAAVTWFRLRRDERVAWPWSRVIVAWVVVAFAETSIASPDFTAAVLAGGVIPAVTIGTNQGYLRRVAGGSHLEQPWSPLRRAAILVGASVITIWIVVYATIGAGRLWQLA